MESRQKTKQRFKIDNISNYILLIPFINGNVHDGKLCNSQQVGAVGL